MPRALTPLLGMALIAFASCGRPSGTDSQAGSDSKPDDEKQQSEKRIKDLEAQVAKLRAAQQYPPDDGQGRRHSEHDVAGNREAKKHADHQARQRDNDRKHAHGRKAEGGGPERANGTIIGVIQNKQVRGNNVQVAILAPGEKKPRSYHVAFDPRAKGPNREVLAAVRRANVGSTVEAGWMQTGHGYALTKFKVLQRGEGKDRITDRKAGQNRDKPRQRTGTVVGVLLKKEQHAIFVKAFGEEKARRYMPEWKGGAPAQGGGLDKPMLKVFHDLKIGSRVEVQWTFDERLRAVKVRLLDSAKDHPKTAAGHGHGAKRESRESAGKSKEKRPSGTVIGVIQSFPAARGGVRVAVLAPGEQKARVYWASEREQREIVGAVRKAKVGARVEIGWTQTNHGPALTKFKVLE